MSSNTNATSGSTTAATSGGNDGPGGGVTMINPHNPEFITKRPWYLGNEGASVASSATAIGLDHQAADVRLEKLPRTLATDETLIEQQRQQRKQLASSQTIQVGMWIEALKRNKPPYRMGKVVRVGQRKQSSLETVVVDVVFDDDGKCERNIPLSRIRWTKAGKRATQVDASLYGKETYDSKRDKYLGYDKDSHNIELERKFATRDEIRKQLRLQEQQQQQQAQEHEQEQNDNHKKVAKGNTTHPHTTDNETPKSVKKDQQPASDSDSDSDDGGGGSSDDDDDEFVQRDEDAKVHTSRLARQGGVGGAQMKVTARNLRIREDTAKYLRNLNLNSAYYDPKSRSMRDNPNPHLCLDDVPFAGDNFVRISGDAIKLAETQLFAWDAAEQKDTADGNNHNDDDNAAGLHPQANPTMAELLQREHKSKSANVKLEQKKAVLAKYGGAEYLDGTGGLAKAIVVANSAVSEATTDANDSRQNNQERKIRFGVSTLAEEYNRDGRKKNDNSTYNNSHEKLKRVAIPSKYEEDVFVNGHTSVWGSYFHIGAFKWGYADDHSLVKNSYGTGANGRIVNDEANEMQYGTGVAGSATLAQARGMLKGIRSSSSTTISKPTNTSRMYGEATSDAGNNLDQNKLRQAVQQEDLRKQQQQRPDDRKRKYNSVDTQVEVTEEEMEAYRLRKERMSDPMAKFSNDEILDYQ